MKPFECNFSLDISISDIIKTDSGLLICDMRSQRGVPRISVRGDS